MVSSFFVTFEYVLHCILLCIFSFSALTLLVSGRKGIRPVKELEWWGTGVVICLERGANDLHIVHLMPLPPRHLLLQ